MPDKGHDWSTEPNNSFWEASSGQGRLGLDTVGKRGHDRRVEDKKLNLIPIRESVFISLG